MTTSRGGRLPAAAICGMRLIRTRRKRRRKMLKHVRGGLANEAGFTLMELIVVVLIVGILAAVGVPLYLGYVRDSRLAEAKALAGAALTASQACAQNDPAGTSCTLANLRSEERRVGKEGR